MVQIGKHRTHLDWHNRLLRALSQGLRIGAKKKEKMREAVDQTFEWLLSLRLH